jgi:hypothetical protein
MRTPAKSALTKRRVALSRGATDAFHGKVMTAENGEFYGALVATILSRADRHLRRTNP